MTKIMRAIINPTTIILTSFLVIYELTAITDDPIFKAGLFVGAVTIEIIIQYDLALGLAYLRLDGVKNKIKGFTLLSFYAWYVVVFALMAGIGFFNAELSARVTAYRATETGKELSIQRINQITETLNILNRQLETEAATGYGPRSEKLMEQIEKLSAELRELTANVSQTKDAASITKNMFQGLTDIFGKSENFFKVIPIGTLIMVLYLGQILTAWRVEIVTPVTSVTNVTPVTSVTPAETFVTPVAEVTPVTSTEKPVSVTQGVAVCLNPDCKIPLPPGSKRTTCSDKCRQTVFRAKKKEERESEKGENAG